MKLWHRHKWRARAAEQGWTLEGSVPATAILWVCEECGAAKSNAIKGRWTIEQLEAGGGAGETLECTEEAK